VAKFSDIYDIYARQVFRYLLSLTGDDHLAEELTQETFYKAFLHIDRFEEKCSMYTWLCQIGRNAYFNECKKRKHIYPEADAAETESNENFVDKLIDKEQVLMVHKALHLLSEPYKEVFTLKVFGELKYSEIAAIFGKTETWAKVTFYRAKQRLIHEMEGLQ
jgi:RNA polymerase sigma-70 factor (ECF subfamily)